VFLEGVSSGSTVWGTIFVTLLFRFVIETFGSYDLCYQNQVIFDDFMNVLGKEQKSSVTNIVPHTVLPLETLSKNISKKEKFGGNGWFYVSIALKATIRCENRGISSDPMIYTGRDSVTS